MQNTDMKHFMEDNFSARHRAPIARMPSANEIADSVFAIYIGHRKLKKKVLRLENMIALIWQITIFVSSHVDIRQR